MKFKRCMVILMVAVVLVGGAVYFLFHEDCDRLPDADAVRDAEKLVKVHIHPGHKYSFDVMEVGVYQHLDRCYTYDVIPEEMLGGLLFQGIHRPPAGTAVEFELFAPARVYFFFHYTVDGGYTQIMQSLPEWKLIEKAPQYDIHNGEHGLRMTMYTLDAEPGVYRIPPTTRPRACYNIVFVPR